MKISQVVLIASLIVNSFTAPDECSIWFENKLKEICTSIDNTKCRINNNFDKCIETTTCTGGTSSDCQNRIPENFHTKKCVYNYENNLCEEKDKECEDFDINIGDKCSDLYPGADIGKRCEESYVNLSGDDPKTCRAHFDVCNFDGANSVTCPQNIPSDKKKQCVWNYNSEICETKTRNCYDYDLGFDKELCESAEPTEDGKTLGKKCAFVQSMHCREVYEKCEDYKGSNEIYCANIIPIKEDKSDYDDMKKCVYDETKTQNKCYTVDKLCSDYENKPTTGAERCISLKSEDPTNKRCVFDYGTGECKDEYKTCSLYNSKTGEKTQEECQNIIPVEISKKCAWNDNTNQCEEVDKNCDDYLSGFPEDYCNKIILKDEKRRCRKIYSQCIEDYKNCGDYSGKDKGICESIIPEAVYSKCILEKDSKCVEIPFKCTEASTQEICENHAKPEDKQKTCIWDGAMCSENYKACEDYKGNNKGTCEQIRPFNGKFCLLDSTGCKYYNKICSDVTTEEECRKIAKTGVSDPDKFVCDYDPSQSPSCFENYKYCSDYRGTYNRICTKIKPYDETGERVDVAYKCELASTGCQRKLHDCEYADIDYKVCSIISKKLEEINNKKHCTMFNGFCKMDYKTCDSYDEEEYTTFDGDVCIGIQPKNYLTHNCQISTEGDRCEEKPNSLTSCNEFDNIMTDFEFQYLCTSYRPDCIYDAGRCIKKSCSEYTFYYSDDRNGMICKEITPSNPNKKCVLSQDKTKCEEIDIINKETPNPPVENTQESTTEKANSPTPPPPSESSKPSTSSSTPESSSSSPSPSSASSSSSSSSQNNPSQGNSNDSIIKGIQLAIILLCLLN